MTNLEVKEVRVGGIGLNGCINYELDIDKSGFWSCIDVLVGLNTS
jgi:hypothetical protein